MQEAADCFKAAQTLPQNLGAGLWNIVRLVPFKYYEAICLKSLGQEDNQPLLASYFLSLIYDLSGNKQTYTVLLRHEDC